MRQYDEGHGSVVDDSLPLELRFGQCVPHKGTPGGSRPSGRPPRGRHVQQQQQQQSEDHGRGSYLIAQGSWVGPPCSFLDGLESKVGVPVLQQLDDMLEGLRTGEPQQLPPCREPMKARGWPPKALTAYGRGRTIGCRGVAPRGPAVARIPRGPLRGWTGTARGGGPTVGDPGRVVVDDGGEPVLESNLGCSDDHDSREGR